MDMAIIGEDGRRHLLKEVARALEIDVEKVIPDAPQNQALSRPLKADITVVPPSDTEASKSLNPAGEPHGDFNLFNRSGIEKEN
ncbi:hypothetical protein MBAV_000545 [Candidatus Magnetobacterium bavaricum]|uniref:Uncharacterized protein n=1 Tax=Candidatus Magnetobacterium bavaricum TaxID=29290 RepID=A0A0F3GZF9_9BACT|nr:hypothetical protein MBAV_000545 [Candidatus Magnetobacterium bavaricum]